MCTSFCNCQSIPYEDYSKGDAYDALNNFCITDGLPLTIVTDDVKEEYGGN